MAYLYDEMPRPQKSALRRHLDACAACRNALSEWQAAKTNLDTWRLPHPAREKVSGLPLLKWAVAALVILGIGFGIGHFSASANDARTSQAAIEGAIRSSLEKSIRDQIAKEVAREMQVAFRNSASDTLAAAGEQTRVALAAYEVKRQQEYDAILTALDHLNTRQSKYVGDLAAFRRETETMAVLTEENFRRAQQQMVRLANFTESDGGNNGRNLKSP